MRAFGVAVVGTGFIGPVHVEALRRLGQNVIGVLGSNADKSANAARSLGLSRGYATFEELLADPAIEVVHLTSPNRHHYEQCRQVLMVGKHVVCEKPLAMTSTETHALLRLAEASRRIAAVCYNVRFYPMCLQAHALIRTGQLGRVLHLTGSYLQDWLLHDTDFNWRVLAGEGGHLRAVADIGTHWLDLVQFITGLHVEEVCADLRTIHPVRLSPQGSVETFQTDDRRERLPVVIDTEDYGSILVRFREGVSGCFTVSQVNAGRKNCIRFEIAASQGALVWDSEEPNLLTIGRRDRANESLPRDPSLLQPSVRPYANYPGGHAEGFPDTFKQLFRAIYAAIEAGQMPTDPLFATFADGHREVTICEAIARSHQERRWVTV